MLFSLLMLAGCPGASDTSDTVDTYLGPPTATVPSFYGSVPSNLIVISMDTFRRDAVTKYGSTSGSTPYLDQLMEEGFTLDSHISCSNWTMQSVLCAQTGANNLDIGVVPDLSQAGRGPIPDTLVTLAGALGGHGYYSSLASGNDWFSATYNMDLGFTWSDPATTGNAVKLYEYGTQPLIVAQSLGQADDFYLHLHFVEPHAPYNPPSQYLDGLDSLPEIDIDLTVKDEQYARNKDWPEMTAQERSDYREHLLFRYDAEMTYFDDQIKEVIHGLKVLGLLEDTLVVFWTDHGEAFFEHDVQTHAYSMHRTENDAIAFFWAENIVPGSFGGPTTHADIAPNILSLLVDDVPDTMTGLLLNDITDDRVRYAITAGKQGVEQSVMSGDLKLIYDWGDGAKELYNLATDPNETTNLYDKANVDVTYMWTLLAPKVEEAQKILTLYTPYEPGI